MASLTHDQRGTGMWGGGCGAWLRVLDRDPGAPLEVGDEGRAPFGISRKLRVVRGLAEQMDPAGTLLFAERLSNVPRDHAVVTAEALAVRTRASQDLAQPRRHTLRMVGCISAKSGASNGSSGTYVS